MKNPNTKKEEFKYLQITGRITRAVRMPPIKKNTQTFDFFGINTPPTQAGSNF